MGSGVALKWQTDERTVLLESDTWVVDLTKQLSLCRFSAVDGRVGDISRVTALESKICDGSHCMDVLVAKRSAQMNKPNKLQWMRQDVRETEGSVLYM